jgi:DNA-binding NarL/FixJ family response regulator
VGDPDPRAGRQPAKVVLVAAEAITRAGLLRAMPAPFAVVGEADTVQEAERLLAALAPELSVSVLDPDLSDAPLEDACARILGAYPAVRGTVLLHHPGPAAGRAAVRHGARAVFDLSLSAEQFGEVLRDVDRGEVRVAPPLVPHLLEHHAGGGATADGANSAPRGSVPSSDERLTDRERHALSLIAQGYTSKKIAEMVGVSVKAVDMAVERATRRLNAAHRAHAVAIAVRDGLVSPW